MESSGLPGSIQVSPNTYELIKGRFVCEPRGVIAVKGKGEMETYLLISRRDAPTSGPVEAEVGSPDELTAG